VLALGIFKPQLFVLVPVVLVLRQQYRALAGFGLGLLGLVVLSLPLVGVDGWPAWLRALGSPLYQQQVQVGQTWKMQSLPALATALGAPAWSGYVGLGLGALVLAWWLRRRESDASVWAATVLTTLVCSPHVMQYDLVLLLPVVAYALGRLERASVRLLAVLLTVLVGTIAVRASLAALGGWWRPVGAPWSALALFGIWLVVMRGSGEAAGPSVTPRTESSVGLRAARSTGLPALPRTALRGPTGRRRLPRPGALGPAAPD
jgi:hypothetical protein